MVQLLLRFGHWMAVTVQVSEGIRHSQRLGAKCMKMEVHWVQLGDTDLVEIILFCLYFTSYRAITLIIRREVIPRFSGKGTL